MVNKVASRRRYRADGSSLSSSSVASFRRSSSTSSWSLLFLCLLVTILIGDRPISALFHGDDHEKDPSDGDLTNVDIRKNKYYMGCFHAKLGHKQRVCNSHDDPNVIKDGLLCRQPPIQDYMEIRIFCQDWESVLIETWVLQLILSEIMDVPTTVETGFVDAEVNFYDIDGRYEYAYQTQLDIFHSTYRQAMENGHLLQDCRLANKGSGDGDQYDEDEDNSEEYQQCAHMVPEICASEEPAVVQEYVYNGIFDTPKGLGALGMESWFIPKFTAERDPTLTSYLGMAGEDNRLKMAQMFKEPITFQRYCDEVSPTNCENDSDNSDTNVTTTDTTDDDDDDDVAISSAAKRPPNDETEGGRYFVEGVYTGYFMENDCSGDNGTTCTGHIADYPCTWPSYVWEQTQELKIALESRGPQPGNAGYALAQMEDMWRAANATKENIIMQWWTPQALHQLFHGTEAEFMKVNLPTPTEECLRAREVNANRCSPEYRTDKADFRKGSCDTVTASLYKMKIANLYDITHSQSIPIALQSPAYDVIELFRISEFQLTEIFTRWKETGDPREAVCQWAVDNMDYMKSFVPNSYPRKMVEENDGGGLLYAAVALSSLVIFAVSVTSAMVFMYRQKRSIVIAQLDFLALLLTGDLFISTAALVMVVSASQGTCVAVEWIINVGYTLELVPLLVKVSAVTRLAIAAQKMKRVNLTRQSLFGTVFAISGLIVLFMIIWTVLDAPKKQHEYILTDDVTDEDETIVEVYEFCKSDSIGWYFASVGWMTVLLLAATVLALEMRKVQSEELKESGTLATLIYFHAVFVLIRLVTYSLDSVVRDSILIQLRSLIFSFDALSTVLFYVMPKFFAAETSRTRSSFFSGTSEASRPLGKGSGNVSSVSKKSGSGVDDESNDFVGEDKQEVVQALKALLQEKEREIDEYKAKLEGKPESTL